MGTCKQHFSDWKCKPADMARYLQHCEEHKPNQTKALIELDRYQLCVGDHTSLFLVAQG